MIAKNNENERLVTLGRSLVGRYSITITIGIEVIPNL